MSDVTVAPAPAGVAVPAPDTSAPEIWKHTPSGEGPLSPRDAARSLVDARRKRDAQTEAPAAPEAAAVEPTESAQAGAAPPQEVPSETQEAEPAELPPIEAPRSWTKDEKERFGTYPRELQAYLSEREQEREREFRRSQNEAAEQRKAAEAERVKAEQVRVEYEKAYPALVQALNQQMMGEFNDIQSMADVEKLSREDPFRFAQWQASRMKLEAAHQEQKNAEERRTKEAEAAWKEYVAKSNAAFIEKVPELADPEKLSSATKEVAKYLREIGLTDQEMQAGVAGKLGFALVDPRLQTLMWEAYQYRSAKAKAKAVTQKPVPPVSVQKPGVSRAPSNGADERIQALTKQLDNASGNKAMRLAAQIVAARRAAR
jgi:hypothetical protein